MPGRQGDNEQRDGANGKRDASQARPTAHDEEQLSAYLDGELSADERAALELHLTQDVALQRALGELRQTRALLRALPAPALPRSFALPEVGALDALAAPAAPATHAREKANREDEAVATATGPLRTMPRVQVYRRDAGAPRPIPRATRAARFAQAFGSLVAVLGLALLLTATLPALAPSHNASATSSAPVAQHTYQGAKTGAPSTGAAGPVGTVETAGTFGGSTNQQATSPSTHAPASPTVAAATTGEATSGGDGGANAPVAPLAGAWLSALGILLLIGGVILFAYGRFARPRR